MNLLFDIKPLSYYSYMKQNRYGKYVSKTGKQYKKDIVEIASKYMEENSFIPYSEKLQMNIKFSFDNKRKNDLDNFIKPLFDCLTGIVFDDDRWVYKLVAEKEDGLKYNKIEVFINILEPEDSV